MSDLQPVFAGIASAVADDFNEDDIERLFQALYLALGYLKPGQDIRGKRRGESGAPDVALLNSDRTFQVIVELKRPSEKLSLHRRQLVAYVQELKSPWGILSNGRRLELHKRDGLTVNLVGDFDLQELANDSSPLKPLLKQNYELQDFATVERRIALAITDPLPLKRLESFSVKFFLETFDLSMDSAFGKLIHSTMELFDSIEGKSTFQDGSFGFWKKFFARNLGVEDVPDGWLPFIPVVNAANLSKFMFVLETAYAMVARLILAKAVQDKDPTHVLAKDPLSSVLLNHLRASRNPRSGRLEFSSYPEAIASVFLSYSQSAFVGVFAEDIFDWWKEFGVGSNNAKKEFGEALSELLLALIAFDFSELEGDVLGELYQFYFDPDTRKALGEFYTPPELVDLILDQVGYEGEGRLLDPACGSGTFLIQALRRYLHRNRSRNPVNVLRGLTEGFGIVGFDVNPFAILMAEVNFAAHLIPLYAAAAKRDPSIVLRRLPIVRTDSLRQEPREGDRLSTGTQIGLDFGDDTIRVRADLPVGPGENPLQVSLTFPRLEVAMNSGIVNNEREWLVTLQAIFECVDAARRVSDPTAGPIDLKPYLSSSLARSFKQLGSKVSKLISYADEVWKLLAYLKKEHGDGRFLKTLEDLVLGLVLKHDLSYDFVVGNPPYVRIQNLPQRQRDYWSSLYSWAEGNYDIYVPFIERPLGTDRPWLVEGGHLGYVVSNSFLVTGAGETLRTHLPASSKVESIIDFKAVRFADGNLFRGAMTYTCVFTATRQSVPKPYSFPVIRFFPRVAPLNRADALRHVGLEMNKLNRTTISSYAEIDGNTPTVFADAFWESSKSLITTGWYFMPPSERQVFSRLDAIGELLDPTLKLTATRNRKQRLINYTATDSAGFAGVQTSLDDVLLFQLIDRNDKKQQYLLRPKGSEEEYWIEQDAVRPFLFGRDVWRWNIEYRDWYVVFPYFQFEQRFFLLPTKKYWSFKVSTGRGREKREVFERWPPRSPFLENRYPLLFKYLLVNEKKLRNREQGRFKAGRADEWRWYDLAYPRSLEAAHKPKIVAQLLARSAQFADDPSGRFLFQAGGKGGGVYGISLNKSVQQRAILALLNADVVDFYLRHITQFYNPAGSCSYADAFLKHLPIARFNTCDATEIAKGSELLAALSVEKQRLKECLQDFPNSATAELKAQNRAIAVGNLSDLAEVHHLPSVLRASAMSKSRLLDGRISISFGRGSVSADESLADLIEMSLAFNEGVDRETFLETKYPTRAQERARYSTYQRGLQEKLKVASNEGVDAEAKLNEIVERAYGITSSDRSVVSKFLGRF